MKTEWQRELLSYLPPEFEQINPTTYIQRRNIQENTEMENGGYVCESRFVSEDIKTQIELISDVVNSTADVDKYKDGYDAAVILLGGEV